MVKKIISLVTAVWMITCILATCIVAEGDELPTMGWNFTASSTNPREQLSNIIDGNPATHWHSLIEPKALPPHWVTVELPETTTVSGLRYTPRGDDQLTGNILDYNLYGSADGAEFVLLTNGSWADDHSVKTAELSFNIAVKYVKLEATKTNQGYCSIGELRLLAQKNGNPTSTLQEVKQQHMTKKKYMARENNDLKGCNLVGTTIQNIEHGDYIGFHNVDFSYAKSIAIQGSGTMENHMDSDVFQIRIDGPTGKVIGYCDINDNTGSLKIFKTNIEQVEGVHHLYLVSMFGISSAAKLYSVQLSTTAVEETPYEPVPESAIKDNYHDTWVAVDGLGRAVADYEETGAVREDKTVGLFYWPWHATFSNKNAANINDIITAHPEIRFNYNSPYWPTGSYSFFWNEPIWGYYTGDDYWVLRKQIQMLSDAGVDVLFFDSTNGSFAWRKGVFALCKALRDAKEEGLNVPKIAYISTFGDRAASNIFLKNVYLTMYKPGNYSDLWYYLDGKPLILCHPEAATYGMTDAEDKALGNEIKNFFTFRRPQPAYLGGPTSPDYWGWLEVYPQNGYSPKKGGGYEQVTAGISANHNYEDHTLTAMNTLTVTDRAYTDAYGPDKREGVHLYGYFFEEQMERVRELDPDLVFITGWNEWTAGRHSEWQGVSNAFPDQFDNRASRDIEPSKGDLKDHYYYQLVDEVRKFKGTRPIPTATEQMTVDIQGALSQWDTVGPDFINDKGAYDRDYKGYGSLKYTNTTARNNIVLSKVARDDNNLYFYAKTAEPIISKNADGAWVDNWMTLYLNIDSNAATGWNGYDYGINIVSPTSAEKLVVSRFVNGAWETFGEADYVLSGDTLQIKVDKRALGVAEPMNMEFKWSDNGKNDNLDPMDFWTEGNTAPVGRFNYKYTAITQQRLPEEIITQLADVTVVRTGSNKAVVNGARINAYDADTRIGAIEENGVVYIPASLLHDAINAKVVQEGETLTVQTRGGELAAKVGDKTVTFNKRSMAIPAPVLLRSGIPFVPVSLLELIYDLQVAELSSGAVAFGKSIPADAVQEAAKLLPMMENLVEVKDVSFVSDGKESTSFPVQSGLSQVAFQLQAASNRDAVVYVAVYAGELLLDVQVQTVSLVSGQNQQSMQIMVPDAADTIKIMVWDQMKDLAGAVFQK